MSDEYAIRDYRPTDREAYLDLFATVFDGAPDSEWFAWKYERNPYVEDVPIVVAESGGEIVGARSFFALEMETGARRVPALQPCDTMVHPEHRRRGLFTRMTEAAIDGYRGTDVPFFFNYPNANSLPGNLKLGWRVVGSAPTAYRIQRPGRYVEGRLPAVVDRLVGATANGGATAYHWVRRQVARTDEVPSDVTIERRSTVPAEKLASIDDHRYDGTFRPARTKTFYEWRFENPEWDYEAYLARRDGDYVAGFVVGSRRTERGTTVQFTDVTPQSGADPSVIARLADRVLADRATATTVVCATERLPPEVRAAFGFHSDDAFPLSRMSRPATLVVRPVGPQDRKGGDLREEDWTVDGARLDDPTSWSMSLSDRDWC